MKIPNCVGVIMDGNRRWAKQKGLQTFEGHAEGYNTLKNFLRWAKDAGVKNVIAFAFSLENWKRSEAEVSFILKLILKVLEDERDEFIKEKTSVRFIGKISMFSKDIQEKMLKLEKDTEQFTDFHLALAVSYGGREEIVNSANECIKDGLKNISEEDISNHLYTKNIPDPDMIIRTSGEERISGFLLWQSTYSELFFTNTYWPDFSKEEFEKILEEFDGRERRLGK